MFAQVLVMNTYLLRIRRHHQLEFHHHRQRQLNRILHLLYQLALSNFDLNLCN
jgi:hypothetical protein